MPPARSPFLYNGHVVLRKADLGEGGERHLAGSEVGWIVWPPGDAVKATFDAIVRVVPVVSTAILAPLGDQQVDRRRPRKSASQPRPPSVLGSAHAVILHRGGGGERHLSITDLPVICPAGNGA